MNGAATTCCRQERERDRGEIEMIYGDLFCLSRQVGRQPCTEQDECPRGNYRTQTFARQTINVAVSRQIEANNNISESRHNKKTTSGRVKKPPVAFVPFESELLPWSPAQRARQLISALHPELSRLPIVELSRHG